MEVVEKYVIYKLRSALVNDNCKVLERIEFNDWKQNDSFDTEKEAIQALIDNEMTWEDYVILKTVYIEP